jgi:hypothetical protein
MHFGGHHEAIRARQAYAYLQTPHACFPSCFPSMPCDLFCQPKTAQLVKTKPFHALQPAACVTGCSSLQKAPARVGLYSFCCNYCLLKRGRKDVETVSLPSLLKTGGGLTLPL